MRKAAHCGRPDRHVLARERRWRQPSRAQPCRRRRSLWCSGAPKTRPRAARPWRPALEGRGHLRRGHQV